MCAVDGEICDRLGLLPMYAVNQDKHGTAFTVRSTRETVWERVISASDRATTMRLLADPAQRRGRLHQAGHVVPLRARTAGCCAAPATPRRRRPGKARRSAAAGAICEIVSQKDEGAMAQTMSCGIRR